ncbi:MAG: virulence RhuM family protein [Bacillota bacterium]|nr:virulence RhuM family protein [Bacillota bacterium]
MSKEIGVNIKEKQKKEIFIRSSAAEYLTFIAANGNDQEAIEIRYEDENIWLSQKMMASLYGVSTATINEHLKNIFEDKELQEEATIRKFLIVQKEGSRNVSRETKHYNLQAIIAVGFKVNNQRAVQFRKWANQIVKDYTIKGWAIDDERLKNSGTKLTKDYFDKLLVQIREIRLSERRFYQKITDIYATSLDYDPSAKATRRFFAAIQNKLHYAIHGKTAAELIVDRANHKNKNMGLTTWEGSPDSKIHKYDVVVAKNYLNEEELNQMQRIVSAYLDMAELQAQRHIPMTMEDWEKRLNGFLELWDKDILKDAGKVSAELAKDHAESEFEKYRIVQDKLYKSDFDKFLELENESIILDK